MNTVWLIIFYLSMLSGMIALGLFIFGLVKKKFKFRPWKSMCILVSSIIIFFISAFAYAAPVSETQKENLQTQQLMIESEVSETVESTIVPTISVVETTAETTLFTEPSSLSSTNETTVIKESVVESKESTSAKMIEETVKKNYEYDALQKLFISIRTDTTVEELDQAIAENSLEYSAQSYNKEVENIVYVIAYEKGVAKHRYADSGDYLKVSFDLTNNQVMHALYANNKGVYPALFYNYGTYFDLSFDAPSEYSGYYINDHFSKESGITITYDNGRGHESNYFPKESAEEAINSVIDRLREKEKEKSEKASPR